MLNYRYDGVYVGIRIYVSDFGHGWGRLIGIIGGGGLLWIDLILIFMIELVFM